MFTKQLPQVLYKQFRHERCKVEKFPILYKHKHQFWSENLIAYSESSILPFHLHISYINFLIASKSNILIVSFDLFSETIYHFPINLMPELMFALKNSRGTKFIRYIDSNSYFCIPLFISFAFSSSNINVCFSF